MIEFAQQSAMADHERQARDAVARGTAAFHLHLVGERLERNLDCQSCVVTLNSLRTLEVQRPAMTAQQLAQFEDGAAQHRQKVEQCLCPLAPRR